MFGDRQLSVISPATRDKEVFKWIPCRPGEIKDENSEIVDVISWVVSDVKEMSENPALVELLKETDRSSYDDVSKLCDVYNKAIIDLWDMWIEENTVPEFFNRKASRGHVQFILLQCYNRAVSDPDKLNQYPPFSPQVYGETSFELISQMIDTIAVTSDDVFIDLGSGVGQVVLQVCASTDAKFCYGIEKAEYPANCASRLDSTFRHWMSFYGKSYRPYTLERGDFLSAEYQEKITNAGVLFANNFAFGPEVDHQLKQRFANLKEGARIISSKAFCPLNFRITDRNLGDIGSIMRVSCLNPIQDAVSWTDKPFSYYVHTIDRSLLEQYFARLKNPKSKNENRTVRRDRKGRVISEATMRERDSRNSSSSPYVSSLSSANRSPNSQIDEITSLNSLTKRSDLELKSVQSPDLSIFPENKLDKDKHEDSFHIRIKFKISNSPSGQNHPVSVKIKPPCNSDNTPNRLSNPENSNDTCDTDVINKDHPNSVANRRILRKCRQMLSDDSSSLNVTNFKNSNNRTIALRKRMQNHFMDSGNRNKSPSVHSNSCKTNNKLKYTRRYSLDKLSHNMNVLHDYTVTHVQSQLTPTQFGLNDKRFPTYTCHYQPVDVYTESSATQLSDSNLSDPHTGYNKAPVPFALTQYLELTKQAFMDHFAMLHSPAYASTIQSELEREHNRQAELLKHTKFLEQSIAKLHSDGTDLLNRFTKRLGILITTPAAFFSQARRLIKQHHVLEEKIAEFRRQISLLSSANQELVRRHHIEAARLLATATAIKSDNSFQNQHPTLNKLICSGNDVKVTEINKNGFHYNSDNMLPSSTSSESNYRNAISLNSVVIPPPPSLTKVSHNTLNCNKFGIPSIATSDNLVSAHEMNQQHSLNPIKSSNIKLRTSNGAPSVLRNNTDVHKFAPVLIKTVNTSNHSAVSVHTTNNKADRDHKVITDNSNNHNNTNNTTNNGTNHRIDKHMNIPPPPPLLPMHIHSDVYVDGALSSAKSPTDFNKHKYCNSNNNPSLLPELNRSFITCRTDYDMSLIQSNYRSHTKSMHASLQDLILDEFSRETPCISVSNCPTVTKTNKNRNVYSMSDSSYSCQYENNPDPLFQRHNHHNHNHKILHPNYIDYSHQLNLPPRKRHWDSSNYNPTTTNNYGEECEPPKLSRECKSTDMET
ncbi:unnamed protein product [Schistosoma curassoni]|nr:unnamed protein product [Schistosoma curassoni]